MSNEPVGKIVQRQKPGHCGPTSLSSAAAILGLHASARELARLAGKPYRVYTDGLDEHDLKKAARAIGAEADFLSTAQKEEGAAFAAALRRHLKNGLPAVLMVEDFQHWVSVVGVLSGDNGDRYIIMDPNADESFNRWAEKTLLRNAWCDDPEIDTPQYFAILVSRADGAPPAFKITKAFIRLNEIGAEQTVDEFAQDLKEMSKRASGGDALGGDDAVPLEQVLVELEPTILGAIDHWVEAGAAKANARARRSLYTDYTTIAAATGIRLPSTASRTELVAQLTAIMTTYAWTGEL